MVGDNSNETDLNDANMADPSRSKVRDVNGEGNGNMDMGVD